MIEAWGIAEILLYDESKIESLNCNKTDIKIKILDTLTGNYHYRIKYFIHFDENPEFQQVEDYIGIIKKELERKIKVTVAIVQNHSIKQVQDRIKHFSEL